MGVKGRRKKIRGSRIIFKVLVEEKEVKIVVRFMKLRIPCWKT